MQKRKPLYRRYEDPDVENLPQEFLDAAALLLNQIQNPKHSLSNLRINTLYVGTVVFIVLFLLTKSFVDTLPKSYKELHMLFEIGFNYSLITPLMVFAQISLHEINRKEREKLRVSVEKILRREVSTQEVLYLIEFLDGVDARLSQRDKETIIRRILES